MPQLVGSTQAMWGRILTKRLDDKNILSVEIGRIGDLPIRWLRRWKKERFG
jgi:hypothetical protein